LAAYVERLSAPYGARAAWERAVADYIQKWTGEKAEQHEQFAQRITGRGHGC